MDEPDRTRRSCTSRTTSRRCTSAASASSKARRRRSSELTRDGRAASSTSSRATARRSASCRSASARRCGSTTRTSASTTTCATPPYPPRAARRSCATMAARVFSQHLDRTKPLWEIWMVEGLEHGRWALLSKVHHCMVDGVAATDLMSVMFADAEPAAAGRATGRPARAVERRAARPRRCAPRASPRRAAARARALRAPRRDAPRGTASSARAVAAAAPTLRPVGLLADRPDRPAPALELGGVPGSPTSRGPRRPRRHRQRRRADDHHQRLPRAAGRARREDLARARPSARWCPCRSAGPASTASTTTASRPCSRGCPVGLDDPAERLRVIRAEMDGDQGSPSRPSPATCSLALRLRAAAAARARQPARDALAAAEHAHRDDQRPRSPAAGPAARPPDARVLPLRPVVGTIRIVVAIFSYDGGLYFGVTGDCDRAPDIDVLTAGIESGLVELRQRATVSATPA